MVVINFILKVFAWIVSISLLIGVVALFVYALKFALRGFKD